MASVDLYRTIGDEVGLETGWREVGSLRLASVAGAAGGDRAPGGLGEDLRAPARADLRRGGAAALPADDDGRRPRRRLLPTDGYVDPSQLTFALAEGAAGAEIATNTRDGGRQGG